MADFHAALAVVSAHESGYVNKPGQYGGEHYAGIARWHYPKWKGWTRIDAARQKGGFPESLRSDRTLRKQVLAFYKHTFWDRLRGDEITDQTLANELYDIAVTMGVRRAVRLLQLSLNLLNHDQRYFADLIVDGWFGKRTLSSLDNLLRKYRDGPALMKMLEIQQGAHHVEILMSDAHRLAR